MKKTTSKESIQKAFNYETLDVVLIDFGSTPASCIHRKEVEALINYYSFE